MRPSRPLSIRQSSAPRWARARGPFGRQPPAFVRGGPPWARGRSARSLFSLISVGSVLSILSLRSAGSILSIGSIGSVLSIGSAGSILSIGSAGSILSIGSAGGVLRIGGRGSALDRQQQATPLPAPPTTEGAPEHTPSVAIT